MTMTLDASQQQRFGHTMNLDYHQQRHSPAFSNPWSSSSSQPHPAPSSGMFVGNQQQPPLNPGMMAGKPPAGRPSNSSGYGAMPVTSSAGTRPQRL